MGERNMINCYFSPTGRAYATPDGEGCTCEPVTGLPAADHQLYCALTREAIRLLALGGQLGNQELCVIAADIEDIRDSRYPEVPRTGYGSERPEDEAGHD